MTYQPGDSIEQQAAGAVHRYTVTGTRPHVNRRGNTIALLEWAATCASCDAGFELTTGPRGARYMTRNCPSCRSTPMASFTINASAKRVKVMVPLDPEAFIGLEIKDNAPHRTSLVIEAAGRIFKSEVSTKSVRRTVKTLAENGAENVSLMLQGVWGLEGTIVDAGISAQLKAKPEAEAAAQPTPTATQERQPSSNTLRLPKREAA